MAGSSPETARRHARCVFFDWLERTGDHRVAAQHAGIAQRTGRLWAKAAEKERDAIGDSAPWAPRTHLVGREREIEELDGCLGSSRVATLLGCGGIGKTRLAVHYARIRRADGSFRSAWFCDLVGAQTVDDLLAAVSRMLAHNLRGSGQDDDVAVIGTVIRSKGSALWVFDNCEGLERDARATLGTWIDQAGEARFLFTSRRRLGLDAEAICTLDRLPTGSAVDLLVERARLVRPGYAPGQPARATLADIAGRLDGIPLAIEIAAAYLRHLDEEQLLARLWSPLEALVADNIETPDRHRTMVAAVEWSWASLSPRQQRLVSDCCVFRGGFTVDAVQSVASDPHVDSKRAVRPEDALRALLDHSVVRSVPSTDGRQRYDLFEIVREFVLQHADASSVERARRRHARYYLEKFRDQRAMVSAAAFHELSIEAPNLEAIVRWAETVPSPSREMGDLLLEALLCLDPLRRTRGPFRAHAAALTSAIEASRSCGGSARLRAEALIALGRIQVFLGNFDEALAYADEAERLARETGERSLVGRALLVRGNVSLCRSELREATQTWKESLAMLRDAGAALWEGKATSNLGVVSVWSGRRDDARNYFEQALAIQRRIGDRSGTAITLAALGNLYVNLYEGRPDLARSYARQAVEILRELGDRYREAQVMWTLGQIDHEAHNLDEAASEYHQTVELARAVGARRVEAAGLWALGTLDHERGNLDEAYNHYQRALDLLVEIPDRRLRCLATAGLAAIEALRGSVERSTELFDVAHREAEQVQDPSLSTTISILRGTLLVASGQTDQALRFLNELGSEWQTYEDVRLARRLLQRALDAFGVVQPRRDSGRADDVLELAGNGRHIRLPDGRVIDIGRRLVLRRLFQRLAAERQAAPGRGLSREVLFQAGWPEQHIAPESAANRVYVAMATLRKLGLRDLLMNDDDGYFLDPEVPFRLGAEPGSS